MAGLKEQLTQLEAERDALKILVTEAEKITQVRTAYYVSSSFFIFAEPWLFNTLVDQLIPPIDPNKPSEPTAAEMTQAMLAIASVCILLPYGSFALSRYLADKAPAAWSFIKDLMFEAQPLDDVEEDSRLNSGYAPQQDQALKEKITACQQEIAAYQQEIATLTGRHNFFSSGLKKIYLIRAALNIYNMSSVGAGVGMVSLFNTLSMRLNHIAFSPDFPKPSGQTQNTTQPSRTYNL